MLNINNLSKIYTRSDGASIAALNRVSITVEYGEFVAVQGPSGCGKTTLLLAAGGLLMPTGGTVEIDSCNPYLMSPDNRAGLRAAGIGFVFQQFHLISYLSILDNVLAPSLALSPSPGRKESTGRAEKLIEHFKLSGRMGHYPSELSTGERQRTALARALMNRPKLLLADEPTGNLDPENSRIVLSYLAEFAAHREGAVLMVTHSNEASRCADRTVQLKDGAVRG